MNPLFAKTVSKVFVSALDFLDNLTAIEKLSVNAERAKLENTINLADGRLGSFPAWRKAKYAILAWIDEQCTATDWTGRDYWVDHSLEVKYFPETKKISHDNFYLQAEKAAAANELDALEVFFVCVMLGFRGIYADLRSPNETFQARARDFLNDNQMPNDLAGWVKLNGRRIPKGNNYPAIINTSDEAFGAPPLDARSKLIPAILFSLACIGALAGYLLIQSKIFAE